MAYHITPINDLIKHDISADCICIPLLECTDVDGQHVHVYMHSSLDGREVCESPIEHVRQKMNEQDGL